MTQSRKRLSEGEKLRQKAEEQLTDKLSKNYLNFSETDALKLVHELQVHQIELELTNEELSLANEKAINDAVKYSDLYDFAPSGYITLTREGRIVQLNLKAASMLGKERHRLIDSKFGLYISNETRLAFNLFLSDLFNENEIQSCEVTLSLEDINVKSYVILTGHFYRKDEQVLLIMVDITRRKEAEENLKDKILEVTAINKELEIFAHVNYELEQFAFVASHNLQEPLRTVSNYVQIINEDYSGQLDERANLYLQTIKDASQRMIIQLNSLLDFSRLGRNLKLKKVDCKKIIDDVICDLGSVIATSKANIEVGNLPVINVYADEFNLLFQNLVSNAIKFCRKDLKPEILICCERQDRFWKFSVTDNGIGIPPGQNEKIFLMFQRLHTNSEYAGNGIGLTFCKKIVEFHEGTIWIESVPGKGTTVHFTIADLEP
jgi:two-component system, chemotaxis family, sensor kinase Cph1